MPFGYPHEFVSSEPNLSIRAGKRAAPFSQSPRKVPAPGCPAGSALSRGPEARREGWRCSTPLPHHTWNGVGMSHTPSLPVPPSFPVLSPLSTPPSPDRPPARRASSPSCGLSPPSPPSKKQNSENGPTSSYEPLYPFNRPSSVSPIPSCSSTIIRRTREAHSQPFLTRMPSSPPFLQPHLTHLPREKASPLPVPFS